MFIVKLFKCIVLVWFVGVLPWVQVSAKRSLKELNNVVDSHTETFSQLFKYIRRIEHYWNWYFTHESELKRILERENLNFDPLHHLEEMEKRIKRIEREWSKKKSPNDLHRDLSKLNSTLQLLDDQYMKMSLSFAANKIEINELREDLNLLKQQIQKKEKVKAIGDAVFGPYTNRRERKEGKLNRRLELRSIPDELIHGGSFSSN